jgi:hypothetical protein
MGNTQSKAVWVRTRKALLLFAMALVALALCSGVALAATKIGTDASETLTGTGDNDRITGRGGDDLTIGKKGNDAYSYADGWGTDTVVDSAGKDTVNFSQVSEELLVVLCSDYVEDGVSQGLAQAGANAAVWGNVVPEIVENSHIENARGGPGNSQILGCGLDNKMSAGGGSDGLVDYGGLVIENSWMNFAPSDEVYSDLGKEGQVAAIRDGGGMDVANLKPHTTRQVDLLKADLDEDGTAETLFILTGTEASIYIIDANDTLTQDGVTQDGRIEKVVFKDKTVSSTQLMNKATAAPASVRAMATEGASEVLEDPAGFLEDAQLP